MCLFTQKKEKLKKEKLEKEKRADRIPTHYTCTQRTCMCACKYRYTCLELLPHVERKRCSWGINRGKWKGRQPPGIEPRTPGLCSQCSVTALQQPRTTTSHSQSSIYCTGGTEMPQSHTTQPFSTCCQNPIRGRPENSLHQERTHSEWFSRF